MIIFSQKLRQHLLLLNNEDAEILLEHTERLNDLVIKGIPENKECFMEFCKTIQNHVDSAENYHNGIFLEVIETLHHFIHENFKAIVGQDNDAVYDVYRYTLQKFIFKLYWNDKISSEICDEFLKKMCYYDKSSRSVLLACLIDLEEILTTDNSVDYLYLFNNFSIESIHWCLKSLKEAVYFPLNYNLLNDANMQVIIEQAKQRQEYLNGNLYLLVEELMNDVDYQIAAENGKAPEESPYGSDDNPIKFEYVEAEPMSPSRYFAHGEEQFYTEGLYKFGFLATDNQVPAAASQVSADEEKREPMIKLEDMGDFFYNPILRV